MFDRIAPRYDVLNRVLSVGTDLSWRRRALDLARLGEIGRALDVGTGTGDFALALLARSPRSATVTGVDISAGMPPKTDAWQRDGSAARKLPRCARYRGARRRSPPPGSFCPHPKIPNGVRAARNGRSQEQADQATFDGAQRR